MKDIVGIVGFDTLAGAAIYAADPATLVWVLTIGMVGLLAFFAWTRQGRLSIYGSQLAMALVVAFRFAA